MFYSNTFTTGGYICGQVKLAITLRLLAGDLYLDIARLYVTGYTYTLFGIGFVTMVLSCILG